MSEPKSGIPEWEEVEASGAASWVDEALEHHQKKQDKLSRMLSGEQANLRKEKDALAQAFSNMEEGEVDRGPDLFAQERRKVQDARHALSSVFGEEKKAKQKEDDALRNLFGAPPKSPPRKKR